MKLWVVQYLDENEEWQNFKFFHKRKNAEALMDTLDGPYIIAETQGEEMFCPWRDEHARGKKNASAFLIKPHSTNKFYGAFYCPHCVENRDMQNLIAWVRTERAKELH